MQNKNVKHLEGSAKAFFSPSKITEQKKQKNDYVQVEMYAN